MKTQLIILASFLISASAFAQNKPDSLAVSQLSEMIYNYEAWTTAGNYYFPSNGLVVCTDSGLVLIDTPVNDSLTEVLLDKFKEMKFAFAVITHSHDDRIGGIRTLIKNGIPTFCYYKTAELAAKEGYPAPAKIFNCTDTIIKIHDTEFELFHPGWGHTSDNIVIWLPKYKILYGGCFIKEKNAVSLGNTKEANIKEWLPAIKKVKKKFRNASTIVPGHGAIGGRVLIRKTTSLLKETSQIKS